MHIPLSYARRMADPAMKQHYAARLARAQTDAPFSSGTLFLEAAFQLRDALDAGETPSPRVKLYFAKGIDPHLATLWRIRPVDSGLVHGRRVGTSRNLGPAEWQPRKAAYQRSRRRTAA